MTNYAKQTKPTFKKIGLLVAISIGAASCVAGSASAQSYFGPTASTSNSGRIYGFDNVSGRVGGMSSACEARKGGAILGGFVNSDTPASWNGMCRY